MMGVCVDKQGEPLRDAIIWATIPSERGGKQPSSASCIENGILPQYRPPGQPSYTIEKLMVDTQPPAGDICPDLPVPSAKRTM